MVDIEDTDYLEDIEEQHDCSGDDNEELQNMDNVESQMQNEDLQRQNEESQRLIQQLEPKVGMIFDGVDELYEWYRNYAKALGFPMKKQASRRNVSGIVRSVSLACSRSGQHANTSQNPLKPQASYRIGCGAKLTARLNQYEKWEIRVVVLEHNHACTPSKSRFFRCNRRISAHVKHQLNLNDQAGIRLNKNFSSLVQEAGGYENISCGEKDCRNLIEESRRLRLGEGDAPAIMRYFSRMVAENSGFFFDIELDNEDHLKNVFWADGRSREAYKEFGDVVTFDTTYLTNKYDMPFAPFVGVNHHGQSILLGCALISKEDTDTFVWLFRKWLECMGGCAPQGIITDQARAMKNAIEIVFPNSRHRWCLWHIMKKVPEKFGRYSEHEAICSAMKRVVYDTQSPVEFENQWKEMVDMYELHHCEWLKEMHEERKRWVPCYVRNSFWAGMSTTQRSESMNAFFDGYVHSKTSLKQFVEQYENALRNKVEKETRADADSFSKQIPTATNYLMERQIQEVYTLSKFKEFQAELIGCIYCAIVAQGDGEGLNEYIVREIIWLDGGRKIPKTFTVSFNAENCEVSCSCQLFIFKGILCKHALNIFLQYDVNELPDKYIVRRWRKDVRRAHSKMKVKFNSWENTPEQVRYRELCLTFSEVADLAAQSNHEYNYTKNLVEANLKRLQLSTKSKEIEAIHEDVEEENEEENRFENILDPISQTRKGRPRKNVFKPTIRRSKKKTQQEGNVAISTDISPLQSQGSTGASTHESIGSNPVNPYPYPYPYMQQPYPYMPQQLMTSQYQMAGHLNATPPMYGWVAPQQGQLSMYGLHQFGGDQRNNSAPGPN